MFFVYILQSQVDQSFYVGFSTDPDRRLEQHNSGFTRYTSKKRPWTLVYTEAFEEETEARKREIAIKKKKSSQYIRWLIQQKKS